MRFQSRRSSCGPASLANALSCLGIRRSEDELLGITGTTPEGTSAGNLRRAIGIVGRTEDGLCNIVLRTTSGDSALVNLYYWVVARGRPVIMCVDNYDHWAVCGGYLRPRYSVIDSANNDLVLYYSEPQLLERWRGEDGKYYGIVV
jgi:hypothetical protein